MSVTSSVVSVHLGWKRKTIETASILYAIPTTFVRGRREKNVDTFAPPIGPSMAVKIVYTDRGFEKALVIASRHPDRLASAVMAVRPSVRALESGNS